MEWLIIGWVSENSLSGIGERKKKIKYLSEFEILKNNYECYYYVRYKELLVKHSTQLGGGFSFYLGFLYTRV